MGKSETEILFVKNVEARMCKIWKSLPLLLSSWFPSCYGTLCILCHTRVPYKVTQSNKHVPLCRRSTSQNKSSISRLYSFIVKLSSHNLIMSWRGRQVVSYMIFLYPYTLLLLSWKLCKNREHYRVL